MEADMYNLVPAGGEMNADRSNKQYGIIQGEPREYGKCDFEVNEKNAEPRPEIRGDIARIYFYFAAAYPKSGILSDKNKKIFEIWDKEDPADKAECDRAKIIEKLQGNKNLILEKACKHPQSNLYQQIEERRGAIKDKAISDTQREGI